MKVSKKIFIIFSMILLLVSPVTSLGKDIKWILERPVIPVLVKKPANPVMKITLIRTDNQPYVIRQIDLDLLGSTNVADIVSVAIYGAKKNGLIRLVYFVMHFPLHKKCHLLMKCRLIRILCLFG